jgi:drug/metabolite transporter (DMT)-like permease
MAHSRISTAILAIISCLLWSTAFAGVKIGLEYATPLQFAGTRFFIAGLLVFPLAYRFNPAYFTIVRSNLKLILLFAFLQTFLQYTMFYTGINMIPAAVAAIIIGSQPLFIALVSFGKDPQSVSGHIALTGILLMLGINLLSGFSNVLVAREKGMIPPLVISSSSMVLGGAALLMFSLPLEGFHVELNPPCIILP